MSQIVISKATIEKPNNNSFPEEEASILKQFSPDRQQLKTKNRQKTAVSHLQQSTNNKKKKKHKIKDPIARAEARYKNALRKIQTSQPLSKKRIHRTRKTWTNS